MDLTGPPADRGVYGITTAAELVGTACRTCAPTNATVCWSPPAPQAVPAATANETSTGSAASVNCSPPDSTSPASAWSYICRTRTLSYAQRRRNSHG